MASLANILGCAALAAVLWTLIGLPLAARIAPPALAWPMAPALGWAVLSVVELPLFSIAGMSRPAVLGATLLFATGAAVSIWMSRSTLAANRPAGFLMVALAMAALLALAPMAAIVPKIAAGGVALAEPIFDHSKIAMVDEMARSGVPAANPFFSQIGTPDRLTYYYLWHFSAAVIAVLTGASGWEADAALTWFTAFASLALMAGFAGWIGGRASAAIWVVALAATGSMRPVVSWIVGRDTAYDWIGWASGFGGWLTQISWAPQHVAAAMAIVLSTFLLARLATERNPVLVIVFGLVAAAGFESSVWVGGVTFAIAMAVVGLALLASLPPRRRLAFALDAIVAAGLAAVFASQFLYDQAQTIALRNDGFPIAISPVAVFGDAMPAAIRRLLDVPAYWLIYLPLEFPAVFLTGLVMLALLVRRPPPTDPLPRAFALLALTSLGVGWLLASVIGDNNDLGWRAVLPAVIVLTIGAAAGLSRWLSSGARAAAVLALAGLLLGLPGGATVIAKNIWPDRGEPARAFAAAPEIWAAVRRHMAPHERLANNPLFLSAMTPWPANISWALLANRRSCYAGAELALPFAPLSAARRAEVDAQFIRVFEGRPAPGDVAQLAARYRCDAIVITAQDGAWLHDPFAASQDFRLVENKAEAWRIYRRATPQPP